MVGYWIAGCTGFEEEQERGGKYVIIELIRETEKGKIAKDCENNSQLGDSQPDIRIRTHKTHEDARAGSEQSLVSPRSQRASDEHDGAHDGTPRPGLFGLDDPPIPPPDDPLGGAPGQQDGRPDDLGRFVLGLLLGGPLPTDDGG